MLITTQSKYLDISDKPAKIPDQVSNESSREQKKQTAIKF